MKNRTSSPTTPTVVQHLLVVDDDPDIAQLISTALRDEGYEVTQTENASKAMTAIKTQRPDLLVLDMALPDIDGLSLCKILKADEHTADIPIILLSGVFQKPEDKVHGLVHGADDYLTKPLYLDELVARVQVILRRAISTLELPTFLEHGPLTVEVQERRALLHRRRIPLTPKEFDLLVLFLQRKDKVLSRAHILETVWGYDYYGTTRTVDVHIAHLRSKLGSLGASIETVDTIGYRFHE